MRVTLYRHHHTRVRGAFWVTDTVWAWRIIARNGKPIGASTEGYVRRVDAVRNLEMVTGRQRLDAELVAVGGDVWPVRVIL